MGERWPVADNQEGAGVASCLPWSVCPLPADGCRQILDLLPAAVGEEHEHAHRIAVIQTLTPNVVLRSTVALVMVAPTMSAANPAAANPASQGVSRPIAPASSTVPTR
jgi:hypothetical protein